MACSDTIVGAQVAGVAGTSDTLCRDCWGILASRPWPGRSAQPAPAPSTGGQQPGKGLARTSPRCKRKKGDEHPMVRSPTPHCWHWEWLLCSERAASCKSPSERNIGLLSCAVVLLSSRAAPLTSWAAVGQLRLPLDYGQPRVTSHSLLSSCAELAARLVSRNTEASLCCARAPLSK